MSVWASPQTPLGELTALPQTLYLASNPLAGFKGTALRQEGREGRTRGGEGRGKGEWGREGKGGMGKLGGIAPWLLGG